VNRRARLLPVPLLLVACAHVSVAVPPAATLRAPQEHIASELPSPIQEPRVATRGEIESVTPGWFGPTYFIAYRDGAAPLPGALLAVRRAGESVGTLVVIESGRAFTVVVVTETPDGNEEVHTFDIPPGPRPTVGATWWCVDSLGGKRDGKVATVWGRPARVARPTWDGDEPLREHDVVIVRGRSEDALREARRPRWLE
jgi:hypothetical protein